MNRDDVRAAIINAKLALANWSKYNQPEDYDETVYQAEKVAKTCEALIAALAKLAPEPVDGWKPIEEYPLDTNDRPLEAVRDEGFILVVAPELLDDDFNPTGIGQAHYQDGGTLDEPVEPGAWLAPKWCSCHDEYHLRVVRPTHFRFVPALTKDSSHD